MSQDHDEEHDRNRDTATANSATGDSPRIRGKRPTGVGSEDLVQMLGVPLHAWSERPQLDASSGDRDSRAQIPAGMAITDFAPTGAPIQQKPKKKPEAGPSRDDLSPDVRDRYPDVQAATNLKTRIVIVTVEGGRTRLRFGAGGYQGVKPLMAVKLDGLTHDDILIDGIDGDSSFAMTNLKIDNTRDNGRSRGVTINPRAATPPKPRGGVQKRASTAPARESAHQAAARGMATPSTSLPFLDQIQASFGPAHDVSGIQAHVGGDSAAAMGAQAYATGNHVVFDRAPDLHTAAHEAAHVIQQRRGVQLAGGVGQAGDEYERHADAVADRVVQGKSAADLLGSTSTASRSEAIQHKPDPKSQSPRAPAVASGQKAGSWVHPSPQPGKQLVGNIFFRTKDSTVDTHDRALLGELARAYGGNKSTPVKGTLHGFADPRPSHEPGNDDLSHARATAVAGELLHAFAATNAWYENVGAVGRGVDPNARKVEAEEGFEDIHAPYRRVDVFLDGKAEQEIVSRDEIPDDRPKPPNYGDRSRYWETEYGTNIERGDKPTIEGVAQRIRNNLTSAGADGRLDTTLFFMGVRTISKPPWWDARMPAPVLGRGGYRHDQRPEYVRRAVQLIRDYQLYVHYSDDLRADMHAWIDKGFKDVRQVPGGKQLEERLGHLRFMIGVIGDEASEVARLAE